MNQLIFATHNDNKVGEVAGILNGRFDVQSLSSLGINSEIDEPFDTILENAKEKARVVSAWTGKDCFAEDTGLFVPSLNGEPGVHSARYAGDHDAEANIDKLLTRLGKKNDRNAYFLTIICLILKGKSYIFEGRCEGQIMQERRGKFGFGYDAIFRPLGSDRTFGEMNTEEKNMFSHRKKAMEKMVAFLSVE